jgi:hypothetical protein
VHEQRSRVLRVCEDARHRLRRLRTPWFGVTVVLQWCYSGVTLVLQWCYSGVTVVLQWCVRMHAIACAASAHPGLVLQWSYSGVTVVLHWCYIGVTVVLQWCYSGV